MSEVADELVMAASTEIAEYSRTEAALTDLRARMANVEYDVTTVKGLAVAKADRAEVRGLRTSLEATRKQIKAPALAHCKLIDDEAKRITAELLKLEEPIDQQIKVREAELEAERAAREAAEKARITAIHVRISAIREYVALAAGCRTSARVDDLLTKLSLISLGDFEEFGDEAAAAHLETMERVIAIFDEKKAQEAEQARIKAEQVEAAAKLAAERAEFAAQQAAAKVEADKLAALVKAEADRVAAMQAAQAAKAKAEADAAAAELAIQKAEFEKEAAEARAIVAAHKAKVVQEFAAKHAAIEAQVEDAKQAAEQAEMARFKVAVLELAAEELPITMPAEANWGTADEPSDADVIWTAVVACANAYGWTTEQATTRLQSVQWTI